MKPFNYLLKAQFIKSKKMLENVKINILIFSSFEDNPFQ